VKESSLPAELKPGLKELAGIVPFLYFTAKKDIEIIFSKKGDGRFAPLRGLQGHGKTLHRLQGSQ
jgi:hypothetical protein